MSVPVASEPWPAAQPMQEDRLYAPPCPPVLQVKDLILPSLPLPPPVGSSRVGQVPHDAGLSRTKEHPSNPERGKIFPNREIGAAQAVRALYLFVRTCSWPRTCAHVATQRATSCTRLPFPTRLVLYHKRLVVRSCVGESNSMLRFIVNCWY